MRYHRKVFTDGDAGYSACTVGTGIVRADEELRHIQQSLREQGFYYGPIDGSPGDETTQALRRYQIRNGLAVSGQLNDETRRSVERTGTANNGNTSGSNRNAKENVDLSTPGPLATPTPASVRRSSSTETAPTPALRSPGNIRPDRPAPAEPPMDREERDGGQPWYSGPENIRPDLRVNPGGPAAGREEIPRNGIAPSATLTTLFASTPYEFAPPPVQADVLRRAQGILTRNGFYDGRVDGLPGASTAEALTNYQDVNRLRRTGRLDVSTLGTMRLLPGRQTVDPRRRSDPRGSPDIIFQGRVVD